MGQHPPSYESDPYPTSAQGAAPTPSPYGIEPARPGTPPHGGAPPYAPAPVVFVIPPPAPEQVAEKSLRTARGLGLGAAITGVVSVVFQGLALLSAVLIPLNANDWSVEGVVVGLIAAFMSMMIGPLLILLTWATSFGLALAACINANTHRSTPTPAQWAGVGGVTGGILAASIFQGAPLAILILVAANEGAGGDSGATAMTVAIIVALALFLVHVVLIVKIRALGAGAGPGVGAPGRSARARRGRRRYDAGIRHP